MILHKNSQLFSDAVLAASQRFDISEIYIEKDYWLTLALHTIFHSKASEYAVFKGGTALSKCYKIINRFSEDVDIVVIKEENESGNSLKTKLKTITSLVANVIPELEIDGITNKLGMIRKTAHQYPKMNFKGSFGNVREQIIIEASWLGSFEPYADATVSSYITDLMVESNQMHLIDEYNLNPFNVRVLSLERTFCEKIMSLVRFSFEVDPYFALSNKIRHMYDLHMMLKSETIQKFFNSSDFEKLLLTVANDDIISFKNNNKWLSNHPTTAIIFLDTKNTWDKISSTYHSSFRELVTGKLPDESNIISDLNKISEKLSSINWSIGNNLL